MGKKANVIKCEGCKQPLGKKHSRVQCTGRCKSRYDVVGKYISLGDKELGLVIGEKVPYVCALCKEESEGEESSDEEESSEEEKEEKPRQKPRKRSIGENKSNNTTDSKLDQILMQNKQILKQLEKIEKENKELKQEIKVMKNENADMRKEINYLKNKRGHSRRDLLTKSIEISGLSTKENTDIWI